MPWKQIFIVTEILTQQKHETLTSFTQSTIIFFYLSNERVSEWRKFKSFYRVFTTVPGNVFAPSLTEKLWSFIFICRSHFSSILGIKSDKPLDKPFFEEIYPRNISTVVDDIAILKCVVRNKGDRTVSIKISFSTHPIIYLKELSLFSSLWNLLRQRRVRHIVLNFVCEEIHHVALRFNDRPITSKLLKSLAEKKIHDVFWKVLNAEVQNRCNLNCLTYSWGTAQVEEVVFLWHINHREP